MIFVADTVTGTVAVTPEPPVTVIVAVPLLFGVTVKVPLAFGLLLKLAVDVPFTDATVG